MKPKLFRECANPDCKKEFKKYRTTDKYCSRNCEKDHAKPREPKKRKAIPRESKQRKAERPIYTETRKEFLSRPENKICFIDGCNLRADTIEHIRGRKGYADEWARENKITLYLDERFWKPCCFLHNGELERNPELSKKYQLSKIHGGKKL